MKIYTNQGLSSFRMQFDWQPILPSVIPMAQGLWLDYLKFHYLHSVKIEHDSSTFYYYGISVTLPGVHHTPARNNPDNPKSLRLFDRLEGVSTYLDVAPFPGWQKLLIPNIREVYSDFEELRKQRWGPNSALLNAIYCPLFPDKFKLIGTEDILCPQTKTRGARLPNFSSSKVSNI